MSTAGSTPRRRAAARPLVASRASRAVHSLHVHVHVHVHAHAHAHVHVHVHVHAHEHVHGHGHVHLDGRQRRFDAVVLDHRSERVLYVACSL